MTCLNRVLAVLASVAVASATTAIGVAEEGLPKPATQKFWSFGACHGLGEGRDSLRDQERPHAVRGLRKSNRRTLLWQAVPADSR